MKDGRGGGRRRTLPCGGGTARHHHRRPCGRGPVVVELRYAIEADRAPSGRLRHWRIAGVPDEVIDLHSKRAAEIDAECERRGSNSSSARAVAAWATRKAKEHGVEDELVALWRGELSVHRMAPERLTAAIDSAAGQLGPQPKLTLKTVRRMVAGRSSRRRRCSPAVTSPVTPASTIATPATPTATPTATATPTTTGGPPAPTGAPATTASTLARTGDSPSTGLHLAGMLEALGIVLVLVSTLGRRRRKVHPD